MDWENNNVKNATNAKVPLRSFGFAIRKYPGYGFKILSPINPD